LSCDQPSLRLAIGGPRRAGTVARTFFSLAASLQLRCAVGGCYRMPTENTFQSWKRAGNSCTHVSMPNEMQISFHLPTRRPRIAAIGGLPTHGAPHRRTRDRPMLRSAAVSRFARSSISAGLRITFMLASFATTQTHFIDIVAGSDVEFLRLSQTPNVATATLGH
jgi:hypothetical protein